MRTDRFPACIMRTPIPPEVSTLRRFFSVIAISLTAAAVLLAHRDRALAADDKKAVIPPAVSRPVDFDKDVKPIFMASCVQCHGQGRSKGEFRIDTKATILKGG